ncbi:hypothetical protein NKR23_g8992 [Pleurostoma richardsiae]|uniref:Uncharacterized protein n=1 Tax=Pleurostoma richardsiae TaxID=41990 RepID=A0AA38RGW8_9PEZI|nr:hypothetical protein NKR23_g8992 [Pleurostoma richardsiae]
MSDEQDDPYAAYLEGRFRTIQTVHAVLYAAMPSSAHEKLQLSPDHPFAQVKDDLVRFALDKFLSCVRGAFACPYYGRDPQKHQACLTRATHTLADVKEHLWTDHRQPPHCPSCDKLFDASGDRDQHVIARSCTRATPLAIEGVACEDLVRIDVAADTWFAIWDIVFPRTKRPARRYLSAGVNVLFDFWTVKGPEVVATFLEERNLRDYWLIRDEERSLEALYWDVLNAMVAEVAAMESTTSTGEVVMSDGVIVCGVDTEDSDSLAEQGGEDKTAD